MNDQRHDHDRMPRGPHGLDRRPAHPTPDRISEALDVVYRLNMPDVPPVWAAKVLSEAVSTPIYVGDMVIRSMSIQSGDPEHGAMRSDDHISGFEAYYPKDCPECPAGMATYEYRAHHHMAGSVSETCDCGHVHEQEEW